MGFFLMHIFYGWEALCTVHNVHSEPIFRDRKHWGQEWRKWKLEFPSETFPEIDDFQLQRHIGLGG
jgi:hypothetical protein